MSKIGDNLSSVASVSGIWEQVVKLLLKELRKQWKDAALFWQIAKKLGAVVDLSTEAGWKLVAADIEWCVFHGTPTEEKVAPFLRRKKLIA